MKRLDFNSPVILSFAAICFAVLVLSWLTDGASNRLLFSVYRSPLTDPFMYPRLFFHALGHANLAHFVNNFMLILLIGPMLEERYGGQSLIIMMVVTAFITGILHVIVSPFGKLGASGIVFMLILLGSFTNLKRGRIPITLILILIIYLGREFHGAFTLDNNIAYMTHIVGGLCGALFGFVLNKDTWGEGNT
jgi:membrane associated rhomboid family serine protease